MNSELEPMFDGIPFSPPTLLTNNIGAGDTVIEVNDISVFLPAPNFATIGTDENAETIQYNAIAGNMLSGCIRGVEGIARTWTQDEIIACNFTAEAYNRLIRNIKILDERPSGMGWFTFEIRNGDLYLLTREGDEIPNFKIINGYLYYVFSS